MHAVVAREIRKYDIDVLGITECRWAGFGRMKTQTGETFLYSGREDDAHLRGVAMMLSKKAAGCLISWSPVNDRIITARFDSRFIRITIVQVYAPTNDADEEAKDFFYEQVQKVIDKIPRHDIVILMGDWNAKVGDQQDGEEGVVGHHGLHGERSENGNALLSYVQATIWSSHQQCSPTEISISTHGYHQTIEPITRSITLLSAESLEDQCWTLVHSGG